MSHPPRRITEWQRWEGTSWDHLVQHSALVSPRVKIVLTWILSIFWDGELTITLTCLFHCLTITTAKKLSCSDGISQVIICASYPVTGYYWEESGSLFFIPAHQLFVHIDKVLLSFPFSRLNTVCFLSLSSHERCSSPLILLTVLSWTHSSKSMPFLYSGAQTYKQHYKSPSPVLCREGLYATEVKKKARHGLRSLLKEELKMFFFYCETSTQNNQK